jgi:hypothetical protein
MSTKQLMDWISQEIQSEEGLFDRDDQVTPAELESIINEVIAYITTEEGYNEDDEIEEQAFDRDLKTTVIQVYYFLRYLIKTNRTIK